jgi:hypothetical protein
MAIIVASPRLVQAPCHTPRQMLLVNALCRAWESAGGASAEKGSRDA